MLVQDSLRLSSIGINLFRLALPKLGKQVAEKKYHWKEQDGAEEYYDYICYLRFSLNYIISSDISEHGSQQSRF